MWNGKAVLERVDRGDMTVVKTPRTNRKNHTPKSVSWLDCVASKVNIRTVWWDGDETTGNLSGNYYTFTGRRYDPESELMYYRNRYYSPELGRFVSRDPMDYIDGTHLYAYVGSRPASYWDPFGLSKDSCNAECGRKYPRWYQILQLRACVSECDRQ